MPVRTKHSLTQSYATGSIARSTGSVRATIGAKSRPMSAMRLVADSGSDIGDSLVDPIYTRCDAHEADSGMEQFGTSG